jgi:hypothetical protein
MFKLYKKKLLDIFILDCFINDKKTCFYEAVRSKDLGGLAGGRWVGAKAVL